MESRGRTRRRAGFLVTGAVAGIVLISCSIWSSLNPFHPWSLSSQPSLLVILVEDLGSRAFSCNEEDNDHGSGFQAFCDEAVRFTHAYTPSVMSDATVGSILTAQYPFEHGLRDNGPEAISAQQITLGEAALARGYRTAFFSGGPPVWRRSGLNQGFEIFDDNVALGLKSIYRVALETVNLFLTWQESDAARGRFLAFLFFPDLQFIDAPTTNELGEVRESSFSSQMDAVDEALDRLVKELKRRKIWDSTDIFLVGLQGSGTDQEHPREIPPLNLFSESTRTTLMVKPARKPNGGSTVFNWKVDSNVSLVDVGATLFDLIGGPKGAPAAPNTLAPPYSLRATLNGPQPDWPADRVILSESAWPKWRGFGETRVVLRQGPYLFLFDSPARLYNTLTDTPESVPLPNSDPNDTQLRNRYVDDLRQLGYRPFMPLSPELLDKFDLASDLWRDRDPSSEALGQLRELSLHQPEDQQLRGWRARWAVQLGDWTELKAVASTLPLQPVWSYVAEKNLGENAVLPDVPCLEFLRGPQPFVNPQLPKSCRDDELADLLTWANESASEPARVKAMEQFMRFIGQKALAEKVSEQNQVLGLSWDSVPMSDVPDLIDLVLALPEMRKFKSAVHTHLMAERALGK